MGMPQGHTPWMVKFVLNLLLWSSIKFIYSEKATNFCETSNVDLTVTTEDKSMLEI